MNPLGSCKDMHRLVAESMDRRLSLVLRLRVRAHLLFCDACTNFQLQMEWIRKAMRRFDEH
jgi:hypothetical protein